MKPILTAAVLVFCAAFARPVPAQDAAEGRKVFDDKCAKCHSLDATASGYRGPHLAGLFDRRYGAVEDFHYRMVWPEADPTWTPEHLSNYLEIHHLPDAEARAAVIEFLVEETRN